MNISEIARIIGGVVEGDATVEISGLAGLDDAVAGDLSFLANPRYASAMATTKASAVVVSADWKGACPCVVIRVKHADAAFALAASSFAPPPVHPAVGVHPTVVIGEGVTLGMGVRIGPYCVIEPGAVIGDETVMLAHVYIGHGTRIGAQCRLYPFASVREYCVVGNRCILHNGSVIGSDGFGYAPDPTGWKKIAQIGVVELGDEVEIGANTTIDRARFGKTLIGTGVKIDNLVQIAHNVKVGAHTAMAAQVGVSGSTTVGRHCMLAGQVGVAGHLTIGDQCLILAQAGVTKDVPSGSTLYGTPAMPADKARKAHAHMMRIPDLKERVAELEKRIAELEG